MNLKYQKLTFKIVLILLNILSGILGSFTLFKCASLKNETIDLTFSLIIACLTILLAITGVAVTILESKTWITNYVAFLFCLVILQSAVICIVFFRQDSYYVKVYERVYEIFYYSGQKTIDKIQRRFECCSVEGPNFWFIMPSSCCCLASQCNALTAFQEGCVIKARDAMKENMELMVYLHVGVVAVGLFGMASASFFVKILEKEKQEEDRGRTSLESETHV